MLKPFRKDGAHVGVTLTHSLRWLGWHSENYAHGSARRGPRLHVLVKSVPQGSIAGTGVLEMTVPSVVTGVEALWLPRNMSSGLAQMACGCLGASESPLGANAPPQRHLAERLLPDSARRLFDRAVRIFLCVSQSKSFLKGREQGLYPAHRYR